jgi:hypothetical protein
VATVLLPLLVQMASRPTLEPAQIAIERQLNLQALLLNFLISVRGGHCFYIFILLF